MEELIQQCKKKDRLAQRRLYEKMANKLYWVCKRYLQHEEDIEEALADAFYTIFTKLDQLNNLEAFEGWAKKITVNQCLMQLRKRDKLKVFLEETSLYQLPAETPTDVESNDIMRLLDYLPEGCKMIFNLFAIEGYPHKEIAQMLSISEGTSKSQVNFARKKLQEMVER